MAREGPDETLEVLDGAGRVDAGFQGIDGGRDGRDGHGGDSGGSWLESLQRALLYRSRTLELLRGLSQRYGTVARTGFFPPLISLFGPDANRFVLLDQEQQLSARYHAPA